MRVSWPAAGGMLLSLHGDSVFTGPRYKFMRVSKQDVEQQLRAQIAEEGSNDDESQNASSQGNRRNASRS